MAMRFVPCLGVSLAIARYGWYGAGTLMGSIVVYAGEWMARIAPPSYVWWTCCTLMGCR